MLGMRRFAARGLAVAALAATASVALHCGTDQGPGPGELVILPENPVVEASSGQQFTAEVDGVQKNVSWYVNGVQGGTPETGLVSTDGFYVAPFEVPEGGQVTLRALAVADEVLECSAAVEIERPAGAAFVTVSPDTITLGPGEAMAFSAEVFHCPSSDVEWSIRKLWGSAANIGSITLGGQYQTPASYENDFAVAVRATSLDCPDKVGIAAVHVYAGPRSFSVEMEAFTSSNDADGSVPIRSALCGGASGGKAVEGMDTPGEWIGVPVDVPAAGTYEVHLRYSAPDQSVLQVRVSMEDAGLPTPEASFSLTEGIGFG